MLVTSCPECKTTFRISVGILEKAGGQVRCGRCARIFDANVKLREIDESEIDPRPAPEFKFELQPDPDDEPREQEAYSTPDDDDLPAPEDELPAPDSGPPETDQASAEAAGHSPEPDGSLPEPDGNAWATLDAPDWLPRPVGALARQTWPWAAGVSIASLALVGQLVHHYRSELVARPALGAAVAGIYAALGAEVAPRVDLEQYDLLDLTAVAEPSDESQGWLVIETRVRNQGPKVQPYPHIFVRLLDRWEDTVAARYFAPEEYAVTSIRDVGRMNIGSTIDAQFVIMDPGPSATGFELELCVKSTRGFECESDIAE